MKKKRKEKKKKKLRKYAPNRVQLIDEAAVVCELQQGNVAVRKKRAN